MVVLLRPDEVHILQARVPVHLQVPAVVAKEPRPLTEQEKRDQRQDHNRDDRVAPEKKP